MRMLIAAMTVAPARNSIAKKLCSFPSAFAVRCRGSVVPDRAAPCRRSDGDCGRAFHSNQRKSPVPVDSTIIMKSSSGALVRFQLLGMRNHPEFHALESIYECDDPACCGCGCPVFCDRYAYPEEVSEALLCHVELHHAS
jgi:hypothetical protein